MSGVCCPMQALRLPRMKFRLNPGMRYPISHCCPSSTTKKKAKTSGTGSCSNEKMVSRSHWVQSAIRRPIFAMILLPCSPSGLSRSKIHIDAGRLRPISVVRHRQLHCRQFGVTHAGSGAKTVPIAFAMRIHKGIRGSQPTPLRRKLGIIVLSQRALARSGADRPFSAHEHSPRLGSKFPA